jgi:hypothetical protein
MDKSSGRELIDRIVNILKILKTRYYGFVEFKQAPLGIL